MVSGVLLSHEEALLARPITRSKKLAFDNASVDDLNVNYKVMTNVAKEALMNSNIAIRAKHLLVAFGISLVMSVALLGGFLTPPAQAEASNPARTIMIYMDGGASEANTGVCSTIIKEYLHASFDRDNFRIIVMTGGSSKWHLESQYLKDKNGGNTLTGISNEYNQVWEVYGAQEGETEGYLRLLDGDGVSGDGDNAKTSKNELMYEKDTLKNFINYAKQVAPAAHPQRPRLGSRARLRQRRPRRPEHDDVRPLHQTGARGKRRRDGWQQVRLR